MSEAPRADVIRGLREVFDARGTFPLSIEPTVVPVVNVAELPVGIDRWHSHNSQAAVAANVSKVWLERSLTTTTDDTQDALIVERVAIHAGAGGEASVFVVAAGSASRIATNQLWRTNNHPRDQNPDRIGNWICAAGVGAGSRSAGDPIVLVSATQSLVLEGLWVLRANQALMVELLTVNVSLNVSYWGRRERYAPNKL